MPERHAGRGCCGRCAGREAAGQSARRARYKAAIFPAPSQAAPDPAAPRPATSRAAFGTVVDASPQVLVLATPEGERTLTLMPGAAVWRGRAVEPTDIRPGDKVVLRLLPGRGDVADRIWVAIGRVTGVIIERGADHLVVDEGATRPRQFVALPATARSRILVRFPHLEPGRLIDVIGLRHVGELEALLPATSQPPAPPLRRPLRRPGKLAAPALRGGPFRGTATWHEPAAPDEDAEGLAYPAVDPASGCAEAAEARPAPATTLPYLAVGSMLSVRNDCTGAAGTLPVTTCAALAGLFADRCLACGTSRRGRLADLTVASFVRLGGELERGCFNATLAIGW